MGNNSRSIEPMLLVFWILFPSETTKFFLCNGQSDMGCLKMEREALLEFKNSLTDPARRLSSWVDGYCCTWEGVGCNNETGHVIMINLRNPYNKNGYGSLQGNISRSLLRLDHLVQLDLSRNDFQGIRLPDFIGSMKSLRSLILSSAGFVGTVPRHLGNLSNLHELSLGSTITSNGQHRLKVNDIQWLSRLSSLEHLELDGVDMSSVGEAWVGLLNKLPSLSYLSLSSCSLEHIPQSFPSPKFPSLVYLDISGNHFNSTIPKWLFKVTSLSHLNLSRNWFHGCIHEIVGQVKNLRTLDLSKNLLTGPIPLSLTQLASLQLLYLDSNQLNGSVPSSLGQLSQLVHINIAENKLHGVLLETHFSNLSHLKGLISRQNSLVLKVASDWIPPFQLNFLSMADCHLGPRFPGWIRTQKNLRYLNFRNAHISGTIPYWLGEITSGLRSLKLSHNQLSGSVPMSLKFPNRATVNVRYNQLEGLFPFPSVNFGLLDLSNNLFSGSIPHSIGRTSPSLEYLSLSGNLFNGSIPTSVGRLQCLIILDLSRNQFTGNIPTSLGNCRRLKALDLNSNHLSGVIPKSVSHLINLRSMHLSNNSLSGEFPSLIGCRNLVVLDLGENELSGNIPTWVGESFTSVMVLRLRSNKFNGYIPPELSYLTSLQVLDLADNKLSGPIPPSFSNFSSMAEVQNVNRGLGLHTEVYGAASNYLEQVSVITKGRRLEYSSTLSLVTAIYISGNHLSGEIPESLTTLSGLIVLNLTGNCLTGAIPRNIGNLSALESLDISKNRLNGTIPPSIAVLYNLVGLNLSSNNLSGPIPTGEQIQTLTDPSIYFDNPFLCGYPLQKSCGEGTTPMMPNAGEDEEGSDDGKERSLFYANIGCGFVTGILGLYTVLSLKKYWMDVYFQFIDEVVDKLTGIGKMIYVKMTVKLRVVIGCMI